MSWLSAKGCLCRQPDGWAVGKADGVCHRYPQDAICRPAGCRQSDFFADRSLSAVGKAGYADCLWWLSAKRVFADRDIPSCRQSPGLSAKPRFPVVIP